MPDPWWGAAAIGGLLLLAGCQASDHGNSNDSAVATSPARTPSATLAATGAPPNAARLGVYVGHYPFDAVNGVRFLDQPVVAQAVNTLVPDRAIRALVLGGAGPTSPITLKADKLLAWGCETHNCGAHNWTISIARDGSGGNVCYHDQAAMGARARWYLAAGHTEMRDGDCPSE